MIYQLLKASCAEFDLTHGAVILGSVLRQVNSGPIACTRRPFRLRSAEPNFGFWLAANTQSYYYYLI